jgi:hypothetical protein
MTRWYSLQSSEYSHHKALQSRTASYSDAAGFAYRGGWERPGWAMPFGAPSHILRFRWRARGRPLADGYSVACSA